MDIKYLYTMIMEDQKVIFTSSSATAQEEATGKNLTHFGDVYAEASPILKNAFKTRRITTYDSTDTWGTFHTLYLPQVAQDGTIYVIGADIELTLLNEQLKQNVLNSLKDIFIYFILMLPFVFVYRAHVHYNQHELEDIIAKRVKELQEQKYALDAHAIVAITDTKGTITFVNSKFEAISGYSHAELIGQNHRLINSGTHTEAFWKEMYHTISHGNVWHADICNRAKNGELYWVDTTIIPSMNTLGKPESYISIRTDITALKNSREQILQKEEMLQTLLDSVAEGIYGVDSMGNCTFVNKAFLRILGYDDENEILGQHIHELTHHTRKDGTPYPSNECQIYKTNREHLCAHVEDEVFWKRDGTCIDVEYWSYPILRNGK
jgi:PAS domain S-box-containing protein